MHLVIVSSILFALSFPVVTAADIFIEKNKKAIFGSQTRVIETRIKNQPARLVRLDRHLNIPGSWHLPAYTGDYRGVYLQMARDAAWRHHIPEDLFLRLVQQESNWDPNAVSHKGAVGLAQLMPQTARYLQVDAHDPYQNLDGGARYLALQYQEFGSWRLALAAYNAGPNAVKDHLGVPPYNETRNYIKVILGDS
ncbi:MAG: lytic transglycosylase domain-containing protein [Aestuariivita sp.]|nr:lytic transglycosylase domain-containing protein [Aestuariivita sp.]MCY4203879.1 lytic transglycosylase domain-containing protein [Aestuariivita sp.]